jgi:putative tryptophan/tyrosine transport system substrate-binding protein
MDRRRFLLISLAGALALPFGADAEAQRAERPRPRLIGNIASGYRSYWAIGGPMAHLRPALEDGLRDAGYVAGQDVVIDYRFAEGDPAKLPELTAALIARSVEVLVPHGPAALRVARAATTRIPIVATDFETDPVAAGFAQSLARPGGNVTGAFVDQAELSGKWLELVKETIPRLVRITAIHDASTPEDQSRALQISAKVFRVQVKTVEVSRERDFEGAFAAAVRNGAQAVVLLSSPLIARSGRALADLASPKRLPTISLFKENATEGCLMAYGPGQVEAYRIAGHIVGRVLRGSRPAEIPIERPTRFELVINLKTAKALGLTIPQSLLGRADEVIQ